MRVDVRPLRREDAAGVAALADAFAGYLRALGARYTDDLDYMYVDVEAG